MPVSGGSAGPGARRTMVMVGPIDPRPFLRRQVFRIGYGGRGDDSGARVTLWRSAQKTAVAAWRRRRLHRVGLRRRGRRARRGFRHSGLGRPVVGQFRRGTAEREGGENRERRSQHGAPNRQIHLDQPLDRQSFEPRRSGRAPCNRISIGNQIELTRRLNLGLIRHALVRGRDAS
jgi:hypothetical protein